MMSHLSKSNEVTDEKLIMQINVVIRRTRDGAIMFPILDKITTKLPPNIIPDIINVITESLKTLPMEHPEVMGLNIPIQFNTREKAVMMSVAS